MMSTNTSTNAMDMLETHGPTTNTLNLINESYDQQNSMYDSLSNRYKNVLKEQSANESTVTEHDVMLDVLKKNLDSTKSEINTISDSKANKMRMTEINTYYNQKYQMQINLLKYIIAISIVIIILGYIRKIELIPNSIVNALIIVILVVAGGGLSVKLYDIYSRDNMNFDAYDFKLQVAKGNQTGIWDYNKII